MRFDDRARAWIEAELGPDCRVIGARRLRGGVSSVVHDLTIERMGRRSHVVLRRVPLDDEVPDHDPVAEVATEVAVLARLGGRAMAPRVLAVDQDGAVCGAPSVVQTRLPGRVTVAPKHRQPWVEGLAAAVNEVHDLDDAGADLDPFEPWFSGTVLPAPIWSRAPAAWVELHEELLRSLPPGGTPRLVHRDLHPGNVLFHRGKLSGIVDWTNPRRGPVEVDVSRCRVEVAILAGIDAADASDAFLTACRPLVPGYDRRWDALVALELAPWVDDLVEFNRVGASLTPESIQHVCDELVIAAAG